MVLEMKETISLYSLHTLFLCETWNKEEKLQTIKRDLGMPNVFVVNLRGKSSGLCMKWNDKIRINILGFVSVLSRLLYLMQLQTRIGHFFQFMLHAKMSKGRNDGMLSVLTFCCMRKLR